MAGKMAEVSNPWNFFLCGLEISGLLTSGLTL
jgi:hypothetical protein